MMPLVGHVAFGILGLLAVFLAALFAAVALDRPTPEGTRFACALVALVYSIGGVLLCGAALP